jgi:hypothetical protein
MGCHCSISSKNIARRVFFVYCSNPVIIASVLCLRNEFMLARLYLYSIYTPCGKGGLNQSLPSAQ